MIRFFRENKSTRDTVIGIVAVLFCISAIFGGMQSSKSGLSVGKRQIDAQKLNTQFQQIVKHNPDIDRKALEKDLVAYALSSLRQFQYIENLGLQPSTKSVKAALSEILPKNVSLKTLAKEQHLNQNQLLLSISDQIAFKQLTHAIESTSIVTPMQQKLHERVLTHIRTYIDIDLKEGVYPDDPEAYKAIYDQQNLQHPKVYHLQYVDITPESLKLPQITEAMIQDYFLEHMETYADQDFEYQITSYVPSKTGQTSYKVWPNYIQSALSEFEKQHPHSRVSTKTYHTKRSQLPEDHQILNQLKPGQHYVLNNQNTFTVISLSQRQTSKTLDPNLRTTLKKNLEKSLYSHLLSQKVAELSEYAYTHPTSIHELANKYELTVTDISSSDTETFEALLEDPDFIDKHFVSEAQKVSDLHYRYLQLIDITPQHAKSYEEALDEVKSIYLHNVLFPQIIDELNSANSIEDIEKVCKAYKLNYKLLSTEDHPNESIYTLIPTKLQPHPTTTDQYHWLQLQSITYPDRQEDITPLVQKLDGEILLSTLRNATQ